MSAFVLMAVFTTSGTFMRLFLAALQNLGGDVDEAAMMDGASPWQRFWQITLPQLRPTLFTVLTLGLIGTWQVFDQIYTGTQGGPAKTTLTPSYLSYTSAFSGQDWGRGAAIAFVLFAIIVVLTILQRIVWRTGLTRSAGAAPRRDVSDDHHRTCSPGAQRPSHLADARRRRSHMPARTAVKSSVLYAMIVALAVVYVVPFLVSVATSFKTDADAAANPLSLIPGTWTTAAFQTLFRQQRFPTWATNSAIVAVFVTVGRVFFASLAGYALARLRFRGRSVVFALLVGVMAVPGVRAAHPEVPLVINQLGIYDSYLGMVLPLLVDAAGVFIMKNFFESIHPSVEEQARIDGAAPSGCSVDRAPDGPPRARDHRHLVLPGLLERALPLHRLDPVPRADDAHQGCGRARLGPAEQGNQFPRQAGRRRGDDHPRRADLLPLPAPHHERERRCREGMTRRPTSHPRPQGPAFP